MMMLGWLLPKMKKRKKRTKNKSTVALWCKNRSIPATLDAVEAVAVVSTWLDPRGLVLQEFAAPPVSVGSADEKMKIRDVIWPTYLPTLLIAAAAAAPAPFVCRAQYCYLESRNPTLLCDFCNWQYRRHPYRGESCCCCCFWYERVWNKTKKIEWNEKRMLLISELEGRLA